ncbi:MAG: GNAT family N-acetyltransferase [Chloroflexota bacterium]|nr:GNAT family N-acetyltransferase [Chloroflexota bacterium]
MGNVIVSGDRLCLRPLDREDATALATHVTTESDTVMVRGRVPVSPLAFERWIVSLDATSPPPGISVAVCLLDEAEPGRLIGVATLRNIDWVNRTAETGIGIYPATRRGHGYGAEAKHLLLSYAFDRLHLHAIHATVWEPNTRSARAILRQGYRPAGRTRWTDPRDGTYRDTLFFDLLRPEWEAAHREWRARRSAAPTVTDAGMTAPASGPSRTGEPA